MDKQNNELIFLGRKNKPVRWNSHKISEGAIEVFDAGQRMIAEGEVLICRRSDKKLRIMKGQSFTVTALNEKNFILKNTNGKVLPAMALSDFSHRHFDYGYAITPSQFTASSAQIVIACQNSASRQSHQRAFYQILAKADSQAWIYTENKSQLLTTLQKHTGNKLSAIEVFITSLSSNQL